MSLWNDIRLSISDARHKLQEVKNQAEAIGRLAEDPMILKNMSGAQLARIKHQLKQFNAKTWEWKQ